MKKNDKKNSNYRNFFSPVSGSYTEIKGGKSLKIAQTPEMDGYEAALTNFNMISSVVFTTDEVVDVLKKVITAYGNMG